MTALKLNASYDSKPRDDVVLQTAEYTADMQYLYDHLPQWQQQYHSTPPFPHIVIENFLRPAALRRAIEAFPPSSSPLWFRKAVRNSYKLSCSEECLIPPPLREIIRELNSQHFLSWLSQLTGITGLIPDPYLFGSGLFSIAPGGFLKVHVDFNRHPLMALDRRLNLLLYLNEDWKDEYGGHLELWNRDGSKPEKMVAPIANRCVVFNTTEVSYHGHPHSLTCPPERARNCISVYYYTNGRPENERADEHNTVYIEVPPRG